MDQNNTVPTNLNQDPQIPSPPPVVEPPVAPPQSRSNGTLLALLLILLAGIGFALYYFQTMRGDSSDPTPSSSPLPTAAATNTNTIYEENISVAGFRLGIPKRWEVSISTKTASVLAARYYPPTVDRGTTYLDLQVGPTSQFAQNPTLTFTDTTTEGTLTIRTGTENLLQSKRLVFQVERVQGNNKALLTLYGDQAAIDTFEQDVINILRSALSLHPFTWELVGRVKAQEVSSPSASTAPSQIAGFKLSDWKEIVIMEGPYPERLTEDDHPYKDGFARLYSFTVLPGQRVEVLAEEGKETMKKTGSFIQSELYDSAGQLMTKAGTRIGIGGNNEPVSGGRYYLIVNSYPGKVGEFLLKVFDLDQVQDLYYAHYADGSELLTNNPGNVQVTKPQSAVMIVRFTSPIEIVGDNKIRYFRQKDNACIACESYIFGDITIPYTFRVNNVETPIKITKLFLNQALIQPSTGDGFPEGSQISFEIEYGEDPNNPGTRSGYSGGFRTY